MIVFVSVTVFGDRRRRAAPMVLRSGVFSVDAGSFSFRLTGPFRCLICIIIS